MLTNMDKLYESVAANGPVCVGLDTEIGYLPTTDTAKTRRRERAGLQPRADRRHQGRGRLLQGADRLLRVPGPGRHARLRRDPQAGPRHRPAGHCRHQARRHCQDRRNVCQGPLQPATSRPTSSRWPPTWASTPSAPTCRTASSRARACSFCAAPPTRRQRF